MDSTTRHLWAKQDRHEGDRRRLFAAVGEVVGPARVLYPGSYVDVAPSFVWSSVTYVDLDDRARRFFGDVVGVREIIAQHRLPPDEPEVVFVPGDYTTELGLVEGCYDLLISLYAGFVSEHCTRYLRIAGMLLVNPSHGDAALASIDSRYELRGAVVARGGGYTVVTDGLDGYLIPKREVDVTRELLHGSGRGIAYTKPAFAYLFERVR